jgi:hypothetical protein
VDDTTMKQLAGTRGPAVSLLCPLDTNRPGNPHDPRVLASLRDEAVRKLAALGPDDAGTALIARIDEAIASVDLTHPSPSVAVLAAPGVTRVLPLDGRVEPQVVVASSFATNELVAALRTAAPARVVVLAQGRTRCFDVTGDNVVERRDAGFPVEVEPPTEADTPQRDFPLAESERAEAVKFVFRAVDHALSKVQHRDRRPLVTVGTGRDLAYFDEVTNWRAAIIGRVQGNHERDTPAEIGRLVRPVLAEHAREEEERACTMIREAIGTTAVWGIDEVWRAAQEGRGRRLVVEDGYQFDARVVDGTLVGADEHGTGVFDAVDDAIDAVLRYGGEVVPVSAGPLSDRGHVALLCRF